MYYSFIYPHLIYGIECWGHAADYLINKLLICQKKALRIILKQPPGSHVSHKFSELKIMPVKMLFKYRTIIYYKRHVLNQPDNCNLKVNDYNIKTRKAINFPIKLLKTKTEIGKRSMFHVAANHFSGLAWDLRDQPLHIFKGRLAARLWDDGDLG